MSHQDLGLTARTRSYLVLVDQTLVAQDIAQTINDFDPASDVTCAASKAEAEAALPRIGAMEIAFVAGRPSRFVGSALHAGIVARGGRVVLLGIEAETSGPTQVFDVLPQPFDTAAIMAKLASGQHSAC